MKQAGGLQNHNEAMNPGRVPWADMKQAAGLAADQSLAFISSINSVQAETVSMASLRQARASQ